MLRYIASACIVVCLWLPSSAQPLYFPPRFGTTWETVDPASLGWNTTYIDSLREYLEQHGTKAFIVLTGGRIAIEHYVGNFTRDSLWYWASAGKSVTALLIGLAQQAGALSISQPTATYLGRGWTSCSHDQEQRITIWHQLTMTTGLNDRVPDPYCTNPECLVCLAEPGTRWAYHNAPYTLLDSVLEAATGKPLNTYFLQALASRIGMAGFWVKSGYNNILVSTARSMARLGLLILNRGVWAGDTILADTAYFRQMTTPSQSLNPSYGYLWWLNGQRSFMLPGLQIKFPGSWAPDAPADMIAALGKNGQILCVVPSMQMVVVRMGNPPDTSDAEVTPLFTNEIWKRLGSILPGITSAHASMPQRTPERHITVVPNPTSAAATVRLWLPQPGHATVTLLDALGRRIATLLDAELPAGEQTVPFDTECLPTGIYTVQLQSIGCTDATLVVVAR
jgi:CubicO group peptidase (beta-lactamase class C family)